MINQELLKQAIAEAYRLANQESQAQPTTDAEKAQEGQQNPSKGGQ